MKRLGVLVVLLTLAAGLFFAAVRVFQMPARSDVAIFYVVRVWFLPLPLPLGLLKTPHFWALVLAIGGIFVGTKAVTALRR